MAVCLFVVGAVLVQGAWAWERWAGDPWLAHLALVLWLAGIAAAGMACLDHLRRQMQCASRLSWDGERWTLNAATVVVPRVSLDFQVWMLLRLDMDSTGPVRLRASPAWIAVSRSSLGAAWLPLRRALYSPRPATSALVDSFAPAPAPRPEPGTQA